MLTQIFDLRFRILILIQILCSVAVILTLKHEKDTDENLEAFREVGARLHAAGVEKEAAHYYEAYLKDPNLKNNKKAKMAFSIAELLKEQGEFEKALGYYYQVSVLDASSPEKDAASQAIVAILERLGKSAAAKMEMGKLTSLNKSSEPSEGAVVVAMIGDEKIFLHQVNAAMDELPGNVRESLKNKEARGQFLRQYIAEQILYEKAQRAGLETQAAMKAKIANMTKHLLVQELVGNELKNKVKIEADDLQNYFKANIARYKDPKAKNDPDFSSVKDRVEMDYRNEKSQKVYQSMVEEGMQGQKVEIFEDKLNAG